MKKIVLLVAMLACHALAGDIEVDASYQQWEGDLPENTPPSEQTQALINGLNGTLQKRASEALNSERIMSILDTLDSDEYARKQARYRAQIGAIMHHDPAKKAGRNGTMPGAQKVIIFISESMPMQTLRNYARDLEKVGGVMYMRGMIGGLTSVTPTALFSANVLKKDPGCKTHCRYRNTQILIDPIMFQKYGVHHVPAITVQKDLNVYDYCHNNTNVRINKHVVYGDVSLKYALENYRDNSLDDIEA